MSNLAATVSVRNEERAAELAAAFSSEPAFHVFYERALPRVYGYLFTRCGGDRAAAEDLTQLTFASAIRERRSYDGRSDPIVWLTGIARHKLADHFRTREREERRRLRVVVREVAVDRELAAWRDVDEREALVRALARLPALQRAVLVLHYADGLPVREVAQAIGRSESATESLLSRAREALRRAYEEATDG